MAEALQKTVLIIDDAKMVQRFAQDFFRRMKLGVLLASDGYEGLQTALSARPDLIFLDLMMPRLDGFKTLQVLKSNKLIREIPVIVMTAYTDRINVVSAGRLGAAAVVTKPLSEEILLEKVKQVFGEKFVRTILPQDPEAKKNPFGVDEEEYSNVVSGMVADFVKYFADEVDHLDDALTNKDIDTIRKITHNIIGTGGSFGYDDATTLATRLNETVHASRVNWREAQELLLQLKNRLKR